MVRRKHSKKPAKRQASKRVLRLHLAERMAEKTALSTDEARLAIDLMLTKIGDALAAGQSVEIRRFGTLSIRHWGPRYARNPVTGESWMTEPTSAVHFKPARELRERINHDRSTKDDEE